MATIFDGIGIKFDGNTHCRMKVSIQLELTSGTSDMARAAAFTTKSLTESLYPPPPLSLRLRRTLKLKGKEINRKRTQWHLVTGDTMGPMILSFVERLSLSRRVPYRGSTVIDVGSCYPHAETSVNGPSE